MIRFKPVPENIHQRIASLPDYFGVNPNIIFAYLLKGRGRSAKEEKQDMGDLFGGRVEITFEKTDKK